MPTDYIRNGVLYVTEKYAYCSAHTMCGLSFWNFVCPKFLKTKIKYCVVNIETF